MMLKFIELYKKALLIRKTEELFLELFKQGKISGTVHTSVGQEFTGVFAADNSKPNDFVVSNHRGHGHYISFTNDLKGLIGELLGKSSGCSKGVGGSQHLFNESFLSNGIQGGMLPIAAGVAYANKLEGNNNISIAFLGDGTLGEGILYETLNISSLWGIPIVYILEKNSISQSTSFEQNFSGNLESRVVGFGIDFFKTSIYDIESLDKTFKDAFLIARRDSVPVFIEVEVARLNSHSKGDDNRSQEHIDKLNKIDPLNIFLSNNTVLTNDWSKEIEKELGSILENLNNEYNLNSVLERSLNGKSNTFSYREINLDYTNEKRYNELIYDELKSILASNKKSIIIGEDIENNNDYNPGLYGGAFKVTRDLSNIFKNQVKNTPISEQAITGIGIGLALKDYISIVEIMFGDFTTLVFDQLLQHVSKFTGMYGVKIKLPFILRTPMGAFRGYGPTHSQSLEKHFLGIPGLRVIALNQFIDPALIFQKIIKFQEPTLLIENKTLYTKKLYEGMVDGYKLSVSDLNESFPIIRLFPENGIPDITILCYGGIVDEVVKSTNDLFFNEEILVDIFIVSDLNNSNILGLGESVNNTNKLCIIEEGSSFASYSSEIVSNLIENKFNSFNLLRISNENIIPSSRELENNVLPTTNSITSSIIRFLK